jgi:nucleotide-binding universal stress UspA family protein
MRNKHILVPLDLVRGPASALVAVQEMAAESPVTVTLLHVIDLNILPLQPAINDQLCAESYSALRKLAKLFFGANQAARIIVRFGEPAKEIIAEAKEAGADLIVMCGPKSGKMHLLRRGTTERILKSASCPALVLPKTLPTASHLHRSSAGPENIFAPRPAILGGRETTAQNRPAMAGARDGVNGMLDCGCATGDL